VETFEERIVKYGKSFIIDFSILVRAVGIYESTNETILQMARRLRDDIGFFLEESGEFTLKIIEGSFYIEGTRIRGGVSEIEIFASLAHEFRKRSIGVFEFKSPVGIEDLIQLAYTLKGGTELSDIQAGLEKGSTKGITVGGPVFMQKEEGIDLKDSYAVARRAYAKAFMSIKETADSIKGGTRMKLKKIKRTLQLLVDSILTDESYLAAFTTVRSFEDCSSCHPVNVSILSVILGKKIGLDRQHLRALAIAALLHDIGKTEIPPSILNKKTEFTSKERELIERHPVDGIKVLLKSFGLSEILILSMLVSFEHHMKLDLSGYPVTAAGRRLNLFSRIVSIADDYDSLVSGRVYERKQLGPDDALKLMIGGSGTLYDPSLIKAFAGIFR
jgi:HD-GYP domain-containing protein (c-di-GMP phosphodiesterase class II)